MKLSREKKFWLLQHLGLPLALGFYKSMSLTWRLDKGVGAYQKMILSSERPIVLTYHGDLLSLIPFTKGFFDQGRPVAILSSPSRDGRIGREVIRRLGARSVVGSSSSRSEGGALEMTREISSGSVGFITLDGPRGPRTAVKTGTMRLVRLTKARVYLAASTASAAKVFGSWDRMYLPKPFSQIRVLVEEFELVEGEDDADMAKRLRAQLVAMHEQLGSPLLDGTESP